jgi:nitrous oxide reductase accessory protein NosL
MRITLSMVLLLGLLALTSVAFAAKDKDEAPRCDNCGMLLEPSAARVSAVFEIDSVKHENHFVCLNCVYEYAAEHYDGALPTSVHVLDYNTFGKEKPVMLDASKAWFLYGTSKLAGSMLPYIAAFATKDAAVAQQKTLGGELLEFQAVQEKLLKALAKEAMPMPSAGDAEAVYVCSCTGGCCDGVSSDQPGKCPQCGMDLVLRK